MQVLEVETAEAVSKKAESMEVARPRAAVVPAGGNGTVKVSNGVTKSATPANVAAAQKWIASWKAQSESDGTKKVGTGKATAASAAPAPENVQAVQRWIAAWRAKNAAVQEKEVVMQ
jgi:hypothetical protein